MPLDPSIILANADPKRQFDPTDAMAKALQMKGMVQQQQLQQGQIAAQQQQMQDNADFRGQYGVSPGVAQAAQKMQLGELEKTKAQREAAKAKLETADALADQQYAVYQWGRKAIEQFPDKAPEIHAEVLRRTQENAKTAFPDIDMSKSDDPTSFNTVRAPFAPGQPDTPQAWDVNAQKIWLENQLGKIPVTKKQLEVMKFRLEQEKEDRMAATPKGEIANFAASLGKSVDDPAVKKLWLDYHPKAGSGSGGGIPGAGGGNGKIDDEYLNSLDPVTKDTIIKIGLGKYGTLDSLKRTKGGQAKIDAFVRAGGSVADVNNAVKFQEGLNKTTPGTAGGTYLSVNKSSEHLQRALDNMDKMPAEDPGTPYWVQRAANMKWALTNPSVAKGLENNWKMVTDALMDETEKNILGGKPSVDQARAIEKARRMPFTATRAEKLGALQAVLDLTMGQYDAVETQRQQAMGRFAKGDSMLSPKSQATLAKFNALLGRESEAPVAPTPPRVSLDAATPQGSKPAAPMAKPDKQLSPADLGKLPPKVAAAYMAGKRIYDESGNPYKKGN